MNEVMNMEAFKSEALALITQVAAIEKQKKDLDAQEKDMRAQIQLAMEKNGIKSFNNELLSITYTEQHTQTRLDSKTVQCKFPEIYNACLKTSPVKASIKITVND